MTRLLWEHPIHTYRHCDAWTTTDDNRIERLMSETYGRGYITLDELRSSARDGLATLVKGVQVSQAVRKLTAPRSAATRYRQYARHA